LTAWIKLKIQQLCYIIIAFTYVSEISQEPKYIFWHISVIIHLKKQKYLIWKLLVFINIF